MGNKILVCGPNREANINFVHKYFRKVNREYIKISQDKLDVVEPFCCIYIILEERYPEWMEYYFKLKESIKRTGIVEDKSLFE